MKLVKKLLIATLFVSFLAPGTAVGSQKPHMAAELVADGNTTPTDHDNKDIEIKFPHSIRIITII